jgi:hypothetical protein
MLSSVKSVILISNYSHFPPQKGIAPRKVTQYFSKLKFPCSRFLYVSQILAVFLPQQLLGFSCLVLSDREGGIEEGKEWERSVDCQRGGQGAAGANSYVSQLSRTWAQFHRSVGAPEIQNLFKHKMSWLIRSASRLKFHI